MSLKVLAVGVPRTGSSSLKAALKTLGFGDCMHMDTLFNNPHLVDHWIELYETGSTDYATLFAGFASSTDFPGCFRYRELLAEYPDLKIILNLRDADAWYESMLKTVYPAASRAGELRARGADSPKIAGIGKALSLVEEYLLKRHYGGQFDNREKTIAAYEQHLEDVRSFVPAPQLLELPLGAGWEPLCAFLGVPVPDEPYPFKNKRRDFQEQIGKMLDGGAHLTIK